MQILQFFLLPFSFLYGIIASFRNYLYHRGVLESTSFHVPVISIGNLTTGGTGKSPMIEYLIRIFESEFKIATVSRGYGRNTKGFKIVNGFESVLETGDEPKIFKIKFPKTLVTVDEKRASAIQRIVSEFPEINLFFLDDAFQHRAVKPFCNILLIDSKEIFKRNFMLPSGTLREWKCGMKRADYIIITKCPLIFSPIERRTYESKIKLKAHQKLFFSTIKYGEFIPCFRKEKPLLFNKEYYFSRAYSVLLVTGIANPESLSDYLKEHLKEVVQLKFPDHHPFTENDLISIQNKFDSIANKNKIILTTEKDLVRLDKPELRNIAEKLHLFYIPIETQFHHTANKIFDDELITFLHSFHSKN